MPNAPKLTTVTLRAGTKYQTVVQNLTDGSTSLSEMATLEQDTEVRVGDLGATFNVYEFDEPNFTVTLMVRVENEVR